MSFKKLEEDLKQKFAQYKLGCEVIDGNRFVVKFKLDKKEYKEEIFISPMTSTSNMDMDPVATMTLGGEPAYKVFKLSFDFSKHLKNPNKVLDLKPYYKFPVVYDQFKSLKIFKMVYQINDTIKKFGAYLANRAEIDAKAKEAEKAVLEGEAKLKEKFDEKRKNAEARRTAFEDIKKAVKTGVIESELDNEYVNITLANGLKVRLRALPGACALTDIELRSPIEIDQIDSILKKLTSSIKLETKET